MKLVFMGSPEFAVTSIRKLLDSKHKVLAVVTVPDKEQGRGRKVRPSAVKIFSESRHLPVLQPEMLEDSAFITRLRELNADVFVVVAFKILPKAVFDIPPRGTINLHASLLPKYRGAAPINWALMRGEKKTGVSTIRIDEKVDTGDLLLQKSTDIDEEMTAGELHDRLADLGGDLLVETLDQMEAGALKPSRQDDSKRTRAPKLNRELTRIDFAQPGEVVHNKIRGLSPYPGAYCFHENKMVKLLRSRRVKTGAQSAEPRTVVDTSRADFTIQCGNEEGVQILQVQPEGKKPMSAGAYINGTHLEIGESFR